MLTMEVGTGKTATLLRIYAEKCNQERRIVPMLIFSPPITLSNWKNEFKLWCPRIPAEKIVVLTGPLKKRVELFEKTIARHGEEVIFITNYECLVQANLDLFMLFKRYAAENDIFLCCDESHKLKDSTSKTSKRMYQISQFCKYKFLLTGTPVLNSEIDIFQQFKIMAPDVFGKSITAFRAAYFTNIYANVSHMSFPKYEVIPEMIPKINGRLNANSYHVKKEECLDLPPLVKERYEVEMAPDQKKVYNQMKKQFVAFLKDDVQSTASLIITQTLRLQQIVSGFMRDEDGVDHLFKKNPRAEALRDLLTEITPNHKVIVWCIYKKQYEIVAKVCNDIGVEYVECHGGTKDKDSAVERFESGSARIFVAHPGSGGIGINLISASYSIYYARSFSLEQDLQSEARNYRAGSEKHKKITRIDLVTPGTIDEDILLALESKMSMAARVTMLKEKYK